MAAETLDAQVARLYMQGRPHAEIGEALNLARPYVHKVLSGLFAEAMPKLGRRSLNDERLNAIQQAYLRGGASIQKGTDALERQMAQQKPSRSSACTEQRVITALLMARVDELRKPQALSLQRLAHASDLSMWTLQRMRRELSDPQLTTVLRLCRGLGVTADELLEGLPLPVEPRPRRSARVGADV